MKHRRLLTVLLILTLMFIWGNSMLSREVSGGISDGLMYYLNDIAERLGLGPDFFTFMADQDEDGMLEPTSHIIRKAAHVTEFAVLAAELWLLYAEKGKKRELLALGTAFLCGAVDETIQVFSNRGSQVKDVFIDTAGALLGILLSMAVRAAKNKKASRKER